MKLEGHAMPIRSLCFSADGSLLFTAFDDMRVNVYDPEEVREKKEDVQLEELGIPGASDLGPGRAWPMSDVCMVVDSGFFFTHILPLCQDRALHKSALRVKVGGKLLTNYLREVVSNRQWNMMDDFEV
eukprot:g5323.t1